MRKMIGAMGAALALFATSAAAQPFDDDAVLQQPSEPLRWAPARAAAQLAAARGGILQRRASGRVQRDPGAGLRA